MSRPRRASPSRSLIAVGDRGQLRRCRRGVDEVVTLVGKVQRRLEPGRQIEQRAVDRANALRERALELIERRTRLNRRDRLDEVADGFRLDQIDPPAQVRAERELARLGKPRACAIADATISRNSTGLP